MVIIGVYFMLLFSGTLSPRAKDEAGRQRFEEYREKRGRVVVFTAGLVVFWGVLRLLVSLGFLNL